MLESGDLGGKCADLNALFARPGARLRSARPPCLTDFPHRSLPNTAYKSLGTTSPTKGQHCRAEVYLHGHGWVPVDPADVRKVVLEEPPGNLALTDEKVVNARARLFGSWEMNWMAYNYAADVALPGASFGKIIYFMYPQGETSDGRLDPFDPDAFRYTITSSPASAS